MGSGRGCVPGRGDTVVPRPDRDHPPGNGTHVVHLTFEARGTGGTGGEVTAGVDTSPIRGVAFVKLADLPSLGFSERFGDLAVTGFPGAGRDMGPKAAIGL